CRSSSSRPRPGSAAMWAFYLLPIRRFDDQIGFTQRFIDCLDDPRNPDQIDHPLDKMVRQRVYGILAGYEDCNDHDALRHDPVFKLVGGRAPEDDALASQPTLSRFETHRPSCLTVAPAVGIVGCWPA
ncbi:MAG TPA: transposase, partial [Phycisphaerae bacterium]|nr:transposase [Phycisphaerae bacterium]